MKKNSLYISKSTITALILGLMMVGCDDYLDTEPITEVITEQEQPIQNAEEAEAAMTAIYAQLGGEFWQLDQFLIGDAQTDNAYAGADNVQVFHIDEYSMLSTNSVANRDWGYLIDLIFRSNFVLNYIDDVPDLNDERREEMRSEASFFRALGHFYGVQIWGDFPILTLAITSVNQDNFDEVYEAAYPSRQPMEDVYAQILTDLDTALQNIPESNNKFRANRGAVYALRAKVLATMPNPDWNAVLQDCNSVISQGYALMPVYDELFDGNHEGNQESIMEANGDGWNSPIGAWGASMFLGTDWKKFNTPSNELVANYDAAGDLVRKNSTIWFADTTVPWSDNFWPSNHYPFAYKQRKTDGTQNFYFFRLADILLLKAEALAQTNDIAGAMDLVNQIRNRVGLANATATSSAEALDKILYERKLELAFEGQRWFDLKRFGKTISILSQQTDGNGNILPYAGNIVEHRLIWPVPQQRMDANENLTQNPGY